MKMCLLMSYWSVQTKTFSFYFQVSNIFEDNIKTAARRSKPKLRGLFEDGIQIDPKVYGKHVSIC